MHFRDVIELSDLENDVIAPRPDAARGPDASEEHGINAGNGGDNKNTSIASRSKYSSHSKPRYQGYYRRSSRDSPPNYIYYKQKGALFRVSLNGSVMEKILPDCRKDRKSGGTGSNAARRRCPAAPSDLPKSGGAAAPPAWCIPVIRNVF